ncbi:MAG: transglycosylase SLT domain-containing protein [Burkholderiaceae bacterium]|nr:transglycosylase SLT domain-containing protein [Burkholderiaceae bacterium]
MQQSRFKPLYSFALLTSLALPSAHAADLSIAAQVAGTTVAEGEALDAPHLGPAEFDAKFEQVEISQFDLWERIRQGFAIPDLNNPLVATHVTWYSSRPEYIQRTTQRASRYLFHVVQELEKRNMPMELALLPFIESAFNPQALSSAKAAGMWQFIPSTGREYNLKQNVFRDERRDVVASTLAALNYLQKLYGMFGDWQLALAAYNWGEGSVSRAIAKAEAAGKPIDFNSLSAYMPAETRNYYPKLQAVKNLIAAPAQYGIKLPLVENQPYFVSIKKTRDIDVKLAAELAELPMEEFRALNPQFNRPVITGSSGASILLPQLNADKFTENLSKWTRGLSSWTAHKVTATRERIEVIAARFKTTPQIIREANAIPPNMHPTVGSTVLVPKPANIDNDIARELADHGTLAVEADGPARRRVTIKVGRRDTMASITQRYKVSAAEVREWNDLKSDKLSPGQPLKLMVKAPKKGKTRLVAAAADHGDKPAQAGKRHAKAGKAEKPARERKAVKAERQVKKVEPRKKHGA